MDLRPLSDETLMARTQALARNERTSLADMIEHLIELDRREILIDRGFASLFAYCTSSLGYSEQAAFSRIRAARAAREHPEILRQLRDGTIHLEAVMRLAPHITAENKEILLEKAAGASRMKILEIVADLKGAEPPKPDVMRPLAKPPSAEVIPPPRRIRFEFEGDDELVVLVEKLKALLAHKYPFARLEDVFKEAARSLHERLDPARPKRPRAARKPGPRRRRIPARVRREVWARDGGRCVYTSEDGRRCGSAHALQYDHVTPWALGGASDDAANIRLLCRPHNLRLARRLFGPSGGSP